MRWTDWSLVTPGRMIFRDRDHLIRCPLFVPCPVYSRGHHRRTVGRQTLQLGSESPLAKRCLWDCAISFRLQLGATPCRSKRPLLRAWTCSYVSNYRGEDKLFVAENKPFACRRSRFPAASQRKGGTVLTRYPLFTQSDVIY